MINSLSSTCYLHQELLTAENSAGTLDSSLKENMQAKILEDRAITGYSERQSLSCYRNTYSFQNDHSLFAKTSFNFHVMILDKYFT